MSSETRILPTFTCWGRHRTVSRFPKLLPAPLTLAHPAFRTPEVNLDIGDFRVSLIMPLSCARDVTSKTPHVLVYTCVFHQSELFENEQEAL